MKRIRYAQAAGIGLKSGEGSLRFANHFTSVSSTTKAKIASMGLQRVAGNIYECPSNKELWRVTGGWGIVRLSGEEVDNNESIAAAPKDHPMEFLSSILDNLDF